MSKILKALLPLFSAFMLSLFMYERTKKWKEIKYYDVISCNQKEYTLSKGLKEIKIKVSKIPKNTVLELLILAIPHKYKTKCFITKDELIEYLSKGEVPSGTVSLYNLGDKTKKFSKRIFLELQTKGKYSFVIKEVNDKIPPESLKAYIVDRTTYPYIYLITALIGLTLYVI